MLNDKNVNEITLNDLFDIGTNLVNKTIYFDNSMDLNIKHAREGFEKKYLLYNLEKFKYNVSKMSKSIGMERTALYRKLKLLNINMEL